MIGDGDFIHDLAADYGEYYSKELEIAHRIFIQDNKLTIKVRPMPAGQLEPTIVDGFFEKTMGHFTFARDRDGEIMGYEVWSNDGDVGTCNFQN